MSKTATPKTVYFVLFEGVQLLDVSGPAEVLSQANHEMGHCVYDVRYVSNHPDGRVNSSAGLGLATAPLPKKLGRFHTLMVSGGDPAALTAAGADEVLMRWLTKAATKAQRKVSICSGAFLFGQLGLLDNRRVTTHWQGTESLQQSFPNAAVQTNTLYVHDEDLWTSAGVLSGVDLTLAMVSDDLGPTVALNIARTLVVFLFRDGGQSQFSGPIDLQAKASRGDLVSLIAWLEGQLQQNISVEEMAEYLMISVRTLHRRCLLTLQLTPAQVLRELRLERSRTLLHQIAIAVKTIAHECGFANPSAFSKAFSKRFGITPKRYRQRFHAGEDPLLST